MGRCAPFQAAPGVFVRLDCRRYAPVPTAKRVDMSNKVHLFHAGGLKLDPQSLGTLTPPVLVSGLQSLFGIQQAPTPTTASPPAPQQAAETAQQTPSSVDHRSLGTEGPIKDQQLVGACTAFSLSTVMDNAIRRLNKADVVSAMHVWSRYADPTMPSAASRNENRPLTVWANFPYDERAACRMETSDDGCAELLLPPVQINTAGSDPTIQAQIKNAEATGEYVLAEVDQIDPIDPEVLAVDLATGKDIWFAMGISQDAWTSPQVQSTGVVPDWSSEDGGHASVLAGYRTTATGRQFLVHNSWGPNWGDHGYAWVSEAMVKSHGQYAYTVKVVDRAAPVPPPTPVPAKQANGGESCPAGFTMVAGVPLCQKACSTNADCGGGARCSRLTQSAGPTVCVATNPLTDDDCGEGELVDLVTGQCAPACQGGGRPAAGLCPLSWFR
jgi:hypothetical protein